MTKLFEDVIYQLAPLYKIAPQELLHRAPFFAQSVDYKKANEDGHFVRCISAWPKPCLQRMNAGAIVGRSMLDYLNPMSGSNMFATLLKQAVGVHAGQVTHARLCSTKHELPILENLVERFDFLLSQKHHHETTHEKKTWPYIQGLTPSKEQSEVNKGLRALSYELGTYAGFILAYEGVPFAYARKPATAALQDIRRIIAEAKPPVLQESATRRFLKKLIGI